MLSLYVAQVNKYEGEKMSVQKEAASLTSKLVDAKVTICDLEEENVSTCRSVLFWTISIGKMT